MQKFIVRLTEENQNLIENSAVECFLLDSSLPAELNAKLALRLKSKNKIVLSQGTQALDLCQNLALDGVVMDLASDPHPKATIENTRKQLGKDAIIGAITRNRRHEAMIISEAEPDFLIFQAWNDGKDQVCELVQWYNELFLIQSAVLLREENIPFSDFKCDIVIISDKEYNIFVAKKQRLD